MDVALKSVDSNAQMEDGSTVKKGKSVARIYNEANLCNMAAKQGVKLYNSKKEVIGTLVKTPCDPKTVGVGDRRRVQYDMKYQVFDSDQRPIYTIKGEARVPEMKMWASPTKRFFIYDLIDDKMINTGKFEIRTANTGGCCAAMEADCENSHQLYFPEHASWDQKIMLLMMCQIIEIE